MLALVLSVGHPGVIEGPIVDGPVVQIANGSLLGITDATGRRLFRGIPFATPPLADMRWRPPQPHSGWTGVLNATQYRSPCLSKGGWKTEEFLNIMSEDCLFINVVTPRTPTDGTLFPVAVYFHAGEFNVGTASDRESEYPYFADDVILVTPNSRIGALGYLGSEELRNRTAGYRGTGNYGMLDQTFALRWVQDNIGAFGGDARNVAVWGESSGGTSAAYHLVHEPSWGLFSKAILESPGLGQDKRMADAELNFAFVQAALLHARSPGCARAAGYASFDGATLSKGSIIGSAGSASLAEAQCDASEACAGYTATAAAISLHSSTAIDDVQRRPWLLPEGGVRAALKKAAGGAAGVSCLVGADAMLLLNISAWGLPRKDTELTDAWAPVVDGVELPDAIEARLGAGHVAPDAAVLAGSNLDEGTMFISLTPPIACGANASQFAAWASTYFGAALAAAVVPLYQQLQPPVPVCRPPTRATEFYYAAARASGDYSIVCPTRDAARAIAARGHAVYSYTFRHTPNMSLNVGAYSATQRIGAFHGARRHPAPPTASSPIPRCVPRHRRCGGALRLRLPGGARHRRRARAGGGDGLRVAQLHLDLRPRHAAAVGRVRRRGARVAALLLGRRMCRHDAGDVAPARCGRRGRQRHRARARRPRRAVRCV